MAAIIQGLTNTFIAKSLAGDIDFDTDTFKIALYTNDATLDASTSAYTTTNEVVGTGYVAGGNTLTGATVTQDDDADVVYITFDSPTTWTGTFSVRGALIYDSSSSNYSVCILDFGEIKTITSQTLTVTLPENTTTTALIRFE
jgi:O-acetylhomoserine/O-acetylserine sulfhydrylase-like pyridoxal-dependent enzyme